MGAEASRTLGAKQSDGADDDKSKAAARVCPPTRTSLPPGKTVDARIAASMSLKVDAVASRLAARADAIAARQRRLGARAHELEQLAAMSLDNQRRMRDQWTRAAAEAKALDEIGEQTASLLSMASALQLLLDDAEQQEQQADERTRDEEQFRLSVLANWPRARHLHSTQRLVLARGIPARYRPLLWCDLIGRRFVTRRDYERALATAERARALLERLRAARKAEYAEREARAPSPSPPATAAAVAADAPPALVNLANTLSLIENDVPRTSVASAVTPSADTRKLLCARVERLLGAYAAYRHDEYVQGQTCVTFMLCAAIGDDYAAWVALVNLMQRPLLADVYSLAPARVERHTHLFMIALRAHHPRIYAYLTHELRIDFSLVLLEQFMTLFTTSLPYDVCARLLDVALLFADFNSFILRAAVALNGTILGARILATVAAKATASGGGGDGDGGDGDGGDGGDGDGGDGDGGGGDDEDEHTRYERAMRTLRRGAQTDVDADAFFVAVAAVALPTHVYDAASSMSRARTQQRRRASSAARAPADAVDAARAAADAYVPPPSI